MLSHDQFAVEKDAEVTHNIRGSDRIRPDMSTEVCVLKTFERGSSPEPNYLGLRRIQPEPLRRAPGVDRVDTALRVRDGCRDGCDWRLVR